MTKMHEASVKLFNSLKDNRAHRTPRSEHVRRNKPESPSLNDSVANMTISSDVSTSNDFTSNDFTQESTTKYFFACGATRAYSNIHDESTMYPQVDKPTTDYWGRFLFFSKRFVQLTVAVFIISLFGHSPKSPCRAVFTEDICKASSAAATAMLLYTSWYHVPAGDGVLSQTDLIREMMSENSEQPRLIDVRQSQFFNEYTVPDFSDHIPESSPKSYPAPDLSRYMQEENFHDSVAMSLRQSSTSGFALLDTACWNHLSGERSYFTNVRQPPIGFQATTTACGKTVKPNLLGDIPLVFEDQYGQTVPIMLHECMYMEGFPEKLLISEGQLSELITQTGAVLFDWRPAQKSISFRQDLGGSISEWSHIPYVKDRVSKVHFLAAGQDALSLIDRENEKLSLEAQVCATTPTETKVAADVFHH
jgi:hypothetical protein